MKSHLLIVSTLILLLAVTLAEARTWTSGTHTIEGKFVELTDGGTTVRIEKEDGKRVKIALEKLSPEDRKFVEGISSRSADDDPFEEDEVEEDRGLIVVPAGNQYALLIGVNGYAKPIASLKYCVNDMKLLAESFEKIGVPKENIFLVTDDSPDAEHRPTGANIRQQIQNVTQLMGPKDQLTIAFSGHGAMVGEKSYLCPSDTNLDDKKSIISRDWAFTQMEKCKAKQKIFIIDACRDVVSFGGTKALGDAKTLQDPIGADTHGFILIASCDKTQKSWEHSNIKHGVFTYFLSKGILGAAKDEDGYVSVMNLFRYASSQTKKYVFKEFNKVQVPTFRQGDEMTDFFITKLSGPSILPPEETPSGPSFSAASARVGERKALTHNGIEYAFHWCPPGEFMMGSANGEDDEQPVHKVKLTQGFWILETEVTQAMWKSVMGRSQSDQNKLAGFSANNGIGPQFPVYLVNWDECQEFCRKLSDELNEEVLLPTEAQWEYACRAGTKGDHAGELDSMAWYFSNSESTPHKVAGKHPNKWGLYDMHGNVWEWCSDWYSKDFYANSPKSDPENVDASTDYVTRGGSWDDAAVLCRSSRRLKLIPSVRSLDLGFRVVLIPHEY